MWLKVLCTTGKISRLHSSLSLREGNTSSFLEQDVTLPSSSRFRSEQSVMLPPLGLFLVLGATWKLSLTFTTWAPATHHSVEPLWAPFTDAFLDRTGQDRAVPSEYLSQQACLSAEPEGLKRWTNELLSLTWLWLHARLSSNKIA